MKFVSADVYDTINNEVLKSIMVSRTMANDSFLKQNLRDETNISSDAEISLLQDYLSGIKENFGYDMAFVISAATKNYYYDGGFNRQIDVENNPYDIWYKNFIESNAPSGVSIDTDEFDRSTWGVFVNTRINDNDGNLLGVCGIGLSMADFQKVLGEKELQHNVKIDIFQLEESFSIDTGAVKFRDPHLKEIILGMQANADFSDNQFVFEKIEDDFVVARYISDVNAYLVIRRDNAYVQGVFSNLVFRILVYSGFVLFVLIIFIQVNVGKEHKKITEESKRQGLTSHADKYASMHVIDLKYNTVREISRHDKFNLLQIRDGANAARKIRNSLISTTKYETLRGLLDFIALDTLTRRIGDKRAISYEFLSKEYGWCRANFLLLETSKDNASNQIVFAIEVIEEEKRHAEELKKRSETDLMTGLKNRGSGEKAIADLMQNKVPGMFCLMDADKFKSVNDTYGHGVGDKVIIAIANALKKTFRAHDVVMRLGGDEYAVYATGVLDEEHGRLIIKRLFREIDDIYISEMSGRKISISLGAAIFNGVENISFPEIYKRADSGTYESKKIQGNACTFFKG